MGKFVMKFRTMYDNMSEPLPLFSNCGTAFENCYGFVTDEKTGRTELQIIGESNLDAIIQSNSDSGNIQLIISRLKAGDDSALNAVKGFYADVREMPNTYAEMVSRINDCHNLFNALPSEVKEQFNNSADEFWTLFGTAEFEHKMGFGFDEPLSPEPQSQNIDNGGEPDEQK